MMPPPATHSGPAFAATRRVRRLQVVAADETQARRAVSALEDALRTASLPEADGGRLLLVRALALQPQPGPAGSRPAANLPPTGVALARAVEQQMAQVRASAVHGALPGAGSRPAVYFADEAEAITVLALRLIGGEDTGAWFWPLAVPAWRPGAPFDEALRRLLAATLSTPAGPAAAADFAAALLAHSALDTLLAALRPADGPGLLAFCGWTRSQPEGSAGTQRAAPALALTARWAGPVARWGRAWGGDDRAAWLAAIALVADAPARLADPRLLARAEAALKKLQGGTEGSTAAAASPASAPARPESAAATSPGPTTRAGSTVEPNEAPSGAAGARTEGSRQAAGNGPAPMPAPGTGARGPTAPPAGFEGMARPHSTRPAHTGQERRAPSGRPLHDHGAGPKAGAQLGQSEWAGVALAGHRLGENKAGARPDTADRGDHAARQGHLEDEEPKTAAARPAFVQGSAPVTAYAGLYFLLPLLARLGIVTFLDAHPALADLDLPGRVLAAAARRLRVPPSDPIRATLASLPRATGLYPFTAPAAWANGLDGAGEERLWVVRPVAGRAGTRVLYRGAATPALALWHGRAPDEVRHLLALAGAKDAATAIARGPALSPRSDMAVLIGAWEHAVRLWLRRYASLSLAALVRRPGRIAATRTHTDIFLDHAQADIRIRKAGLDLDPGWLPWMGRVVLFHYVDRDRLDSL